MMKNPKILLLIILCLISKTISGDDELFYTKITHTTDPQAKCLDGSPPAFYLHQGSQKNKFFIYFIGGGFCGLNTLAGTLEDCYQRSKTRRGSSYMWSDTFTFQDGAEGILSLNQTVYANWTKIMITYCDGAMHQGHRQQPVSYKDAKLYFRGNKITRSHFKYFIQNYGLLNAEKILLSGGSAGGVAVLAWANYVQSIIPNPQVIYNVPDSGIFLNLLAYKTGFPQVQTRIKNVYSLAFAQQKSPLLQCNKQYPGQQWRCIFMQNVHPFLKGKYLFINSQYDSWSINNILLTKCVTRGKYYQTINTCSSQQLEAIHNYRNQYIKLMNDKVKSPKRSLWSIACVAHCYVSQQNRYDSQLQKVPSTSKAAITSKKAVEYFVLQDLYIWTLDYATWPANQPCAY